MDVAFTTGKVIDETLIIIPALAVFIADIAFFIHAVFFALMKAIAARSSLRFF